MTTVLPGSRRGHAGLFWCAVGMAVLAVALVVASAFDRRTLLGVPLWDKPLQFAISQAVYTGALAWMLSRLPPGTFRRTGWLIVVCCTVEIVLISVQAGRGVRSHFNTDTPADFAVFGLMGFFVAGIWLATMAIGLRFLRCRVADRATDTGVRFGLVIAVAGMAVGIVMSVHLGHSVGVPDGGPGLPFVNWSTTGGDLRVSHFAGLHALQILPLVAAGLHALPARWLDDDRRHRLMLVAGYGYGALFVLVFCQALRGQPLLAPDALTLSSLAAVVLVAGGAALTVVTGRRNCDGTATDNRNHRPVDRHMPLCESDSAPMTAMPVILEERATMTVDELFAALPTRFDSTAAVGLTRTVQWNITGEETGIWAFEIVDGVGRLIPGGVAEPDTTFTTRDKTWIAIAEGRQDAMKAFMTGKLKVTGDMMLAMKVPEFFPNPDA